MKKTNTKRQMKWTGKRSWKNCANSLVPARTRDPARARHLCSRMLPLQRSHALKKACALSLDGNIGLMGGGNRTLDVPRHASLDDCLKMAKGLFFPNGKSPEGDESAMSFSMGNYSGEILGDLEEDGEVREFRADIYKRVTGLNRPRVYLLSKSLYDSDDEPSEDELQKPTFHSSDSPTHQPASPTYGSHANESSGGGGGGGGGGYLPHIH